MVSAGQQRAAEGEQRTTPTGYFGMVWQSTQCGWLVGRMTWGVSPFISPRFESVVLGRQSSTCMDLQRGRTTPKVRWALGAKKRELWSQPSCIRLCPPTLSVSLESILIPLQLLRSLSNATRLSDMVEPVLILHPTLQRTRRVDFFHFHLHSMIVAYSPRPSQDR